MNENMVCIGDFLSTTISVNAGKNQRFVLFALLR